LVGLVGWGDKMGTYGEDSGGQQPPEEPPEEDVRRRHSPLHTTIKTVDHATTETADAHLADAQAVVQGRLQVGCVVGDRRGDAPHVGLEEQRSLGRVWGDFGGVLTRQLSWALQGKTTVLIHQPKPTETNRNQPKPTKTRRNQPKPTDRPWRADRRSPPAACRRGCPGCGWGRAQRCRGTSGPVWGA
jgi:hypothetical protein